MPTTAILAIYTRREFYKLFMHQLNKFTVNEIIIINETEDDFNTTINGCKIRCYKFKEPMSSIGAKRNLLIKRCKSDYMFFFDDDDIQHYNRIERQSKLLKQYQFTYPLNCLAFNLDQNKLYQCKSGSVSEGSLALRSDCKIRFNNTSNSEGKTFTDMMQLGHAHKFHVIIALDHHLNISNRVAPDKTLHNEYHFFSLIDNWEKNWFDIEITEGEENVS